MKKILTFFIACMLASTITLVNERSSAHPAIGFSELLLEETPEYVYVNLPSCSTLREEGSPMIPYYVKTYTYPLNTRINDITVTPRIVEHMTLSKKIAPTTAPVPLDGLQHPKDAYQGTTYLTDALYPGEWHRVNIGVGLKDGQRVIFVSVRLFPVQYNPVHDELLFAGDLEVKIDCTVPQQTALVNDAYDLLIVAPEKYTDEIQPLVTHKQTHGIQTIVQTTESIIGEYTGRDDAEKLKYAIKNAIEEYGIMYVLLIGGLDSPIISDTWLVPVRYSLLDEGSENSYPTDLYFADIYRYDNGTPVFDDWDSNGNDVFAEWSFQGKDDLDLYPDVYLGRLACRTEKEVTDVVAKIIDYEENSYGADWFNQVLLVGGDTFDDPSTNFYEGEEANKYFASYLPEFQQIRAWRTEGNMNQQYVMSVIEQGGAFLHFSGHGSPGSWLDKTFPDQKYTIGLDVYHMPLLKNEGKYPVTIIGGCHNSLFNTTFVECFIEIIQWLIKEVIMGEQFQTWYRLLIAECFGWSIVKQPAGGAIASLGCTGLGYGSTGDRDHNGIPNCVEELLGWAEVHFAEVYANGTHVLGQTHSTVLSDYINTFDTERDKLDRKTVEEWVLLGDPTLKIGGY